MEPATDYSVFVGDLAFEVDDASLEQTFRTYYPSTKFAKVMTEPGSQRSRGFGFVRFTNEAERDRAITEMTGVYIGSKPIRVSLATQRKPGSAPPPLSSAGGNSQASTATAGGTNPPENSEATNTTLFIGGLSSSVSEAELHAAFSRCGEIVYTKIPPGKGCGFVQFVRRDAAEYALEQMNGHMMGGMAIRVTWGKSTKPPGSVGAHYGGPGHHGPPPPAYGAPGYYPAPYGDPYQAAYPGYAVPAYDPYYGYVDPYAGYAAYGMQHTPGTPGAGPAAAVAAHGSPQGAQGPVQPVMYDPLAPVPVDKLNMAFMHRHVPYMTGGYVRVPMAMPANHI